MSRQKELVKNTAVISLGTFFPKFLTVLITPILTNQLTKTEYGQYDLIANIVSLILPVATLQISSAAFRFLIQQRTEKEKCKTIISTIYYFVLIMAIMSGIVYYLVYGRYLGLLGTLVSLYFVFDILLITTQQVLRGLGKNLYYSISAIIQSVTMVVCVFLLTGGIGLTNRGLMGVVISLLLSVTIPLIVCFSLGGCYEYIDSSEINSSKLKEMLAYSWPMVPNNLSIWVLNLSDRFVITGVLGIEAEAVYAVANKLPTIFNSFQNTFSMAWQENASIAYKDADKDQYYSQMIDWVYRVLTGLLALLIASTPIIWKLIVRGDYDEGYCQVPLLYMGFFFSCLSATIGGIYIAHFKTMNVGFTTMIAAILNLSIDFILINHIGIWAGSISTLISYLFLWLYRMINVQKFQRLNVDWKTIISSVVLLATMCFLNYMNTVQSNIINVLLCIVIVGVFDHSILRQLFNKVLPKKRN